MKRLTLIPTLLLFLAAAAPSASAANLCCVEKAPGTDTVINCQLPPPGISCPSGTDPLDCSLSDKCSQYAPNSSTAADATPQRCCKDTLPDSTYCVPKPDSQSCSAVRPSSAEVLCSNFPDCQQAAASAKTAASTPAAKASVPIVVPKLGINIPTLDLSAFGRITQGTDDQGRDYIVLPFIAVYLAAVYKLGIGVAAVLAVIMIMVGGFQWLSAAGDASRVKSAKSRITSAVVGLLLTAGSYTALQLIDPQLVSLQGLRVTLVKPIELQINDDYTPEVDYSGNPPVTGALPPSQYDAIFQKYAPCAGVTPDVLKAIATAESGLNASRVNASGYVGLFQTKPANCPSVVASYCTDLQNPDNNTAAASAMIRKSIATIQANCPNASAHDQMVMIYVAHNMGGGMLQYVTKQSCAQDGMRQAAIDYYVQNPKTARAYAPKYQASCLNGRTDDQAMAECTAGPKFAYAVKTADKSGVSQVLANQSGGVCPY